MRAPDIRAHYKAMMARDNLHLAVVGDIRRAELRRLMRDIFLPLATPHDITENRKNSRSTRPFEPPY